jgi:predicted N-acyltransferase
MKNITYQIVDSITKIKKDDWDLLFGDMPEGYSFFKTLEESKLEDCCFYYIILSKTDVCLLIAPLFVTDFNLDIAAEGPIKKLILGVRKFLPRFFILRTLFLGSPFGEKGALGIKKDVPDKNALINELVKILHEFCEAKHIPFIIFKDFLTSEPPPLDSLTLRGFFKAQSFPSVVTELNFSSFDEYLKSLGHSTRKNLRKKIKQAHSSPGISIKIVDRVDDIVNDVYRLYENTYRSGSTKFERLTKEYFLSVGKNLGPHAKFFLYYCNAKLCAFNLCFVYEDLFIDKFIGFDYDISHQYNLYYLSWCFNIEWCLKNSIRFYQTGQTDYYSKIRLGGRLVPLYAYLKHRNPILNSLFKFLAKFLGPESFDANIEKSRDV